MLEDIRTQIATLVSLYEKEKQRADEVQSSLDAARAELEDKGRRISQLEADLDNLALKNAFTASGDVAAAKESINGLIREIDRCIRVLEK